MLYNNLDADINMGDMARGSMTLKNPLDDRLGYHIRRLSFAVMADLSGRLAKADLTPTEASILILVGANTGVTQAQVARTLAIKPANMTPLVAGLSHRKLLAREMVDGRSQALRLTENGTRAMREAQRLMDEHEAHLFGSLSQAGIARWKTALSALWKRHGD